MKSIGIIPARYNSTRFPGKPLADICGKSMIMRVYGQAAMAFTHVYAATDDRRIYEHVVTCGGNAVMTSGLHNSGTDRCAEAVAVIENELSEQFDVVINIQGDEPFILPSQLNQLAGTFSEPGTQIATLAKKIENINDITDRNKVKVVFNNAGKAIYFSRSPIPYNNTSLIEKWAETGLYYKHIGLYAYRRDVLSQIALLPQTGLEKSESLEQLRWLENNYFIRVIITENEAISVDTPEDLEKAILFCNAGRQ